MRLSRLIAAGFAAATVGVMHAATIEEVMMTNIALKCSFAAELTNLSYEKGDDPTWNGANAAKQSLTVLNTYEPGSTDASLLALLSAQKMYVTIIRKAGANASGSAAKQVASAMCAMELYRFMSGDKSGLDRFREEAQR